MALNKTIQLVDLDICRTEYKPLANKCPKKKKCFLYGILESLTLLPNQEDNDTWKENWIGNQRNEVWPQFWVFFFVCFFLVFFFAVLGLSCGM